MMNDDYSDGDNNEPGWIFEALKPLHGAGFGGGIDKKIKSFTLQVVFYFGAYAVIYIQGFVTFPTFVF